MTWLFMHLTTPPPPLLQDGNLTIAGQPKLPTWALLNATADVGDTAIVVNGVLNWQVGQSSFIIVRCALSVLGKCALAAWQMCSLILKSSEYAACALSHQLPNLPPACLSFQTCTGWRRNRDCLLLHPA